MNKEDFQKEILSKMQKLVTQIQMGVHGEDPLPASGVLFSKQQLYMNKAEELQKLATYLLVEFAESAAEAKVAATGLVSQ